ncbi:SMC-Scp complex subunit ScpB [Patescibacteria group bacterium]|nr:SMC-Scp complex subunit ScpB [Patescibacteria group bacterium]
MNLKANLEAILFVSLKPLSSSKLASICGVKAKEVEEALAELKLDYKNRGSGLALVEIGREYQLSTGEESAVLIKDYLKDETSGELSQPSLETLTIIAYRGPIAKIELEKIRGVNCSLILRNLLLRGLVEESFDKKTNENFYSVSLDFLRFLGISSVKELPDFEKMNALKVADRFLNDEEQKITEEL